MCCLAPCRARAYGGRAVGNANVVAHPLNLPVCFVIDPRQALELWIELRPLFERFRFVQSHGYSMFEVWRARIRCVDVAVEFCCRMSRLDFADHRDGLTAVLFGFARQTENQRERTGDPRVMTL